MPRYVILRHEVPQGTERRSHWDLMLDVGDALLKTWALSDAPDARSEQPVTQLPDHRAAFLEYEGPISGGRGSVSRWDHGNCQVLAEGEGHWQFLFQGVRLQGEVRLTQDAARPSAWTYRYSPQNSATV